MSRYYPTLLEAGNLINSNSWFDIKEHKNEAYNKKRKKYKINVDYIDTIKIKLNLNDEQKSILLKWLDDCIDVYNMTNQYLKTILTNENYRKILNFINLRKELNKNIREICKINNFDKNTADYAVKHCVEMYKSAFSNHKNINKFNINNLDKNRRRKNLVIQPNAVSKKMNSIFSSKLKDVSSSLPLNIITKNSILQYDSYKKTFIIISPKDKNEDFKVKQHKKCGIDIGVRTFLTTYSRNASYEIGTNTNIIIDKINKRLDNIKSSYDNGIINEKKYKKLNYKYRDKLENLINDMHNKSANFILSNYETVIIGKVSTKKMVSNLKGNLHDIVKRRLMALSHYRFRMKLKSMSVKYGSEIIETDEYLTSKCCSCCLNIKDDLGSSKIYKCSNCDLILDRDINASINIYKNRILSRN